MHRFAILGCGIVSRVHARAIAGLEEARLVGCCSARECSREAFAKETGCSPFTSYSAMLADSGCDVVSICTPSGQHPEQIIAAAEAGKHVVVEKPLGLRLAEADRAIEACEHAGVKLFVVMQNRYNPAIRLLKRAMDAGRFGRIYMLLARVLWFRDQGYYDMAPWRGTWHLDGGCLANQAAHYADIVQWLGGGIEKVHALGATQARRMEAEDSIVMNLRFRSGALGNITATTLTYPGDLEGSLTVLGERGTVQVGGIALNRLDRWDFDSADPMDGEVEGTATAPSEGTGFGHADYFRNVLEVLDGHTRPLVDGREGRKTVELIEAAYRSSHDGGRPVRLPL